MLIRQFVDEDLGNSSYLAASEETGRAVLIDPQRDVDRYIQAAQSLGLTLTHALETHLHADFVSGLRELAAKYDVVIGTSAESNSAFEHLPLTEGDTISLGDITLTVMTTPGHSPEHISFTLAETDRNSLTAIFTGGALIVGGAARTDLLGHHLTEPLTRLLYHTLHDKLLGLPDEVSVYPTHGAGSFCNAPSSSERVTTIGHERLWNPLALAKSEEEFITKALDGLPSYPTYFRYLRSVNQLGAKILSDIPLMKPVSANTVREKMAQGVAVVDTRSPRKFAQGHIPNAYGIPLTTPLSTWTGWVIPFGSPIILVADEPLKREEAVRQLIRIGYDDLHGYLDGGMAAWKAEGFPVSQVTVMSAEELHRQRESGNAPRVLDVRSEGEWHIGHLAEAAHIEGGRLRDGKVPLSKEEPLVVHCEHGDRSIVAISLLEQQGFKNLRFLLGGFSAWQKAGYPVTRED
jgi:hydroxyacylglutathione hydrolase